MELGHLCPGREFMKETIYEKLQKQRSTNMRDGEEEDTTKL
jgi:hypothetical protein